LDPAPLDEPLSTPGIPGDNGSGLLTPSPFVWPSRPKFQDRVWLHVLLLVLTLASTTLAGVGHYLSFQSDFVGRTLTMSPATLLRGLWYSGTILAILGCHELGHYFACRYYDVDASLPFFIPVPFLLTGTMGAFIRIREPIRTKQMLFDIGIAGPIAGFAVAVPALFIGMAMSNVSPAPPVMPPGSATLGQPLLFQLASWVFWGNAPDNYMLNMHPVAFAAWFGLLATALNLFPIGQLDGGHISYAVLGRRSTYVTLATLGVAIVLTYFSTSWLVWTVLMIAMLVAFGPRHPRAFDEDVPLDRPRLILAIVALLMFVLCFTPAPIGPMEIIRR
jgi:membrane-associated protease RseP (regulator of RpoE activity)